MYENGNNANIPKGSYSGGSEMPTNGSRLVLIISRMNDQLESLFRLDSALGEISHSVIGPSPQDEMSENQPGPSPVQDSKLDLLEVYLVNQQSILNRLQAKIEGLNSTLI